MYFITMKGNKPSKKKVRFKTSERLSSYLKKFNRESELHILYEDMNRYMARVPLLNSDGEDTLWETVYYNSSELDNINESLCYIYTLLKTDGDTDALDHLRVDRIDYCTFGNTKPFRIRIINLLNDNYDHFYIKKSDSSRIYGLELEELLSPSSINYLSGGNTLVEEHIAGMPGDLFIQKQLDVSKIDQIRIAKEFIKFNERCFVRLLGDMRSYNFIVDITPDIEGNQYRIRAIDFDQQSYEGWKSFYLPQYFKENNPIIQVGLKLLNPETVTQYQLEERSLIARRARATRERLNELLKCMIKDDISYPKKVESLKNDLAIHHKNKTFYECKSMGEIVLNNIRLVLQKEFTQSIIEV